MKFTNLRKCVIRAAAFALLAFAVGGCGGSGNDGNPSDDTTSGAGLFPNNATAFKMRETVARASSDVVVCLGQPVATQLAGVSVRPFVTPYSTVYFQYVGSSIKMWNGVEMVTFLPTAIKVGDTWSFINKGANTTALVLPRQTITVPEGTYSDCWGIQLTSVRSSQTQITTLWFALNVGLIKQTETLAGTLQSNLELVSRNLPASQATGATLLPLESKTLVMATTMDGQTLADVSITLGRQNAGLTTLTTPIGPMDLFNSGDALMLRINPSTSWTFIPASIQVGSTWSPDGSPNTSGTVTKIETVTVPAGSFNCFVIQFQGINANGKWWCAPGVGVVKYEATHQYWDQPTGQSIDQLIDEPMVQTGTLKYLNMTEVTP
ncbi:MAG: TapB family protein [Armatimonadota bacterium]